MKPSYYLLTDTVYKGTVVREDDSGYYVYNTGLGLWEESVLFLQYSGAFDSPFEGLYKQITASEARAVIEKEKKRWSGYWNAAKIITSRYYRAIQSPLIGLMYNDYVVALTNLAADERERVLLALSGLPKIDNWEQIARQYKLPKFLIEYLRLYHTATTDLFFEYNRLLLCAVMTELRYLSQRCDVRESNKYTARLNLLTTGFSRDEIYANITV